MSPSRSVIVNEGFIRPEPALTPRTANFWTSGADGILRIARCDDCGASMHPPRPVCATCRSSAITSMPTSGRGEVHSFTINRYQWSASVEPPYVVAEVELSDLRNIRLLTVITDCEPEDVTIGAAVEVCFAASGGVWIPLFRLVDP